MSFLTRIAARAVETTPSAVTLRPKHRLATSRAPVQREPEPEPEEPDAGAPAARAAAPATGPAAPLARAVTTEGDGWTEEDYDIPTTDGTPARRQSAAAAPSPVRREPSLAPGEPPPDEVPKPEVTASEPGPNPARALHRDLAPAMPAPALSAAPPVAPVASGPGLDDSFQAQPGETFEAFEAWGGDDLGGEAEPAGPPGFEAWPEPTAAAPAFAPPPFLPGAPASAATPLAAPERPQVLIDRIDVLIHEPAPILPSGERTQRDRARSLDARYLRRL